MSQRWAKITPSPIRLSGSTELALRVMIMHGEKSGLEILRHMRSSVMFCDNIRIHFKIKKTATIESHGKEEAKIGKHTLGVFCHF